MPLFQINLIYINFSFVMNVLFVNHINLKIINALCCEIKYNDN